jgi:hypothetical protein
MKRRRLLLAVAALLAAGGLWIGGRWMTEGASHESSRGTGNETPNGGPQSGQMHQPPNPNRKFEKLTPEERVKLARRGPIGG